MKTAIKMIFALIACAFIQGCSDPIVKSVVTTIDPITRTPLNIKAQIACPDFDMKDGCNFDVSGNTSCNLSDCIKIGIHGSLNVINDLVQPSELELRKGHFEIIDDDQFSYLTGSFEGSVYRSYNELKVIGLIKVNYGQGTFDADAGELNLSIIGVLDQHDDSIMNLHIDIKGLIEKNNPG